MKLEIIGEAVKEIKTALNSQQFIAIIIEPKGVY